MTGRPFDGTHTDGGYVDLLVHRPAMGPVTALLRVERLAYDAVPPFAFTSSRITTGARIRLLDTLALSVGVLRHTSTEPGEGNTGRPRHGPHVLAAPAVTDHTPAVDPGAPPMRWHQRMEARVAVGVSLVVGAALGAVLVTTSRVVTARSLGRAASQLELAHRSFERLLDARADSAAALTRLVTELPVFRAHLTDARLAADEPTVAAMADGYRQQLGAAFCIVTNGRGRWLGAAGWPRDDDAAALDLAIRGALEGGERRDVVHVNDNLHLVVSEPARFADEVLGTMTVGFSLDDTVARELAQVTRYQVTLFSGAHVSGSSLPRMQRQALGDDVQQNPSFERVHVRTLGPRRYIEGAFPLLSTQPAGSRDRLVLLDDWSPTQSFIDELEREICGPAWSLSASRCSAVSS